MVVFWEVESCVREKRKRTRRRRESGDSDTIVERERGESKEERGRE